MHGARKDSVRGSPPGAAAVQVRVERVLTVGRLGDDKEGDAPESTAAERLDQLEQLRRQTAEALGYAYPERLQRVLEVAEGPSR